MEHKTLTCFDKFDHSPGDQVRNSLEVDEIQEDIVGN
jgi:hypothetical protein